jgi:N-terminal domain of reverse transcriptase
VNILPVLHFGHLHGSKPVRLQRRIAKAAKQGRWAKAKALMHLVTKTFYAKLLAVLRLQLPFPERP